MLVVSASKEMMPEIRKVIETLDSVKIINTAVYIHHLKNAQALNMMAVLNNVFNGTNYQVGSTTATRGTTTGGRATGTGGTGIGGTTGGRTGGTTGGRTGGTTGGRTGGTTAGLGGGLGLGTTTGGRTGTALGGVAGGGGVGTVGRTGGQSTLASSMYGGVIIQAEPDTQSLIVQVDPKYWPTILAVIEDLDRAVAQVLIKVLIAEVTHDHSNDLGAELSALNIRTSGLGQTGNTNFGLAAANSGLVVQFLETDFSATIRALEQSGKLDVLSRPYILASDNQQAYILVGQEVPFVTNSTTTDTGNIINTIQYSSVGISIDVIPHINPDGLVTLDIAPEISALAESSVAISNGVNAPVFTSRRALTRVSIRDGHTVVIGGLMQDQKSEQIDKIPLLGDIPVVGALFRRTRDSKSKTELLIFLTPHVASQPEKLKDMTRDEMEHTMLVPGAVYPGAFQEHQQGLSAGSIPTTQERPRTLELRPTFEPNRPTRP
jgi:general secretion pathway protein D